MRVVIASLLAAAVILLWGAVSWMLLSWHDSTKNQFNSDKAVSDVIISNATRSGVYYITDSQIDRLSDLKSQQNAVPSLITPAPTIFAVITLEKTGRMYKYFIKEFVNELICAFLVILLLSKTNLRNYFSRVGFIVLIALTAGIMCHGPYWNWWHFPTHYTVVMLLNLVIGWFFAGLVIAALIKPRRI